MKKLGLILLKLVGVVIVWYVIVAGSGAWAGILNSQALLVILALVAIPLALLGIYWPRAAGVRWDVIMGIAVAGSLATFGLMFLLLLLGPRP